MQGLVCSRCFSNTVILLSFALVSPSLEPMNSSRMTSVLVLCSSPLGLHHDIPGAPATPSFYYFQLFVPAFFSFPPILFSFLSLICAFPHFISMFSFLRLALFCFVSTSLPLRGLPCHDWLAPWHGGRPKVHISVSVTTTPTGSSLFLFLYFTCCLVQRVFNSGFHVMTGSLARAVNISHPVSVTTTVCSN
jgi:hypothetical protein